MKTNFVCVDGCEDVDWDNVDNYTLPRACWAVEVGVLLTSRWGRGPGLHSTSFACSNKRATWGRGSVASPPLSISCSLLLPSSCCFNRLLFMPPAVLSLTCAPECARTKRWGSGPGLASTSLDCSSSRSTWGFKGMAFGK